MVKLHPAALAPVKIHVAAASLRPAGAQTSRLGCGPAGPAAGALGCGPAGPATWDVPRPRPPGGGEPWATTSFPPPAPPAPSLLSPQSGPPDHALPLSG